MSLSLASLMRVAKRLGKLPVRIGRADRLRVYVGQQVLAICQVSGRFRPKVQAKTMLPTPTPDGAGTEGVVPAALTALSAWLLANPHRGAIEWIIGIDHVRYLVLPWDERLSGKSFCHALAGALFAQQFSGSVQPFAAYQLRFAPLSFGQPRLVTLIPSEMIRALTTFALRHGSHSRLITPALGMVWDRCPGRMKKGEGVLALVEGTRLLRVGYDRGHVISLSVQPFSTDKAQAIERTATFVFPAQGQLAPKGLAPDDDARLAFALYGAL